MSLRPITTGELDKLAHRYLNVPSETIIEKVYNSGKEAALRIFAEKVSVEYRELSGWVKRYYRAKKLLKHKKHTTVPVGPPPAYDINAEAAELAEELVGANGGEWKKGRRNTFAKTMNSKARKQRD